MDYGRGAHLLSRALVPCGIGMGACAWPLGPWAAAKRGSLVDEIIMRGNDLDLCLPLVGDREYLITAIFGPARYINRANLSPSGYSFNIPVFARITRGAAGSVVGSVSCHSAARVRWPIRARSRSNISLPMSTNLLIVQGTKIRSAL